MTHLEIKFDQGEGLNLYVNGQSEHLFFDYNTRVKALRYANERFDTELIYTASLYPNERKGAFLWCYTADFLRSENVTDLVRLYFLLGLIYQVNDSGSVKELILHYSIPQDAIKELETAGVRSIKTINYYKSILREWVKVGYHAFQALKRNTTSFFKYKNEGHEGNLLDVNQSPKNNRLDAIENFNFFEPYKVFSGQEHTVVGFEPSKIVVFRNENNLWDGIKIFVQAISITLFIDSQQNRLPKVYRSYFRKRDIFRLWSLLLYERGAEKYFSSNTIKNLVHVSTLTKPEYRILWAKAKEFDINLILVSSRTLKRLSSSERLLIPDVERYSGTVLPDHLIVRDEFSKDVFKGLPFYMNIRLGGRFVTNSSKDPSVKTDEKILYLVLTHIKSCSDFLLSEVSKIDWYVHDIQTIIFRSHPGAKYSTSDIQQIFKDFSVIDHTGKSIDECPNREIIMVSGPTTGALELVREGVSLYWLPYIWKDGILFDDVMKETGFMANNFDLFENLISQSRLGIKPVVITNSSKFSGGSALISQEVSLLL